MPFSVTMPVARATAPRRAVFVMGVPRILMAISVAGTVHTLPFSTLRLPLNRRSFRRVYDDDTIFLVEARRSQEPFSAT